MKALGNPEVAQVFKTYPKQIRKRLMFVRRLIFETAAKTEGVGEVEETLKWGEPAYLTSKTKSGTTVRLGWKKSDRSQYALHFHCQTKLIETFKTLFPDRFKYQGNRSLVFNQDDVVPTAELSSCLAIALTYHRKRKPNHRPHQASNHPLH